MTLMRASTPSIPVSWGELIDKVTILEVKAERLTAPQALANVRRELAALEAVSQRLSVDLDFVQQLVKDGRLEAVELKKDMVRVSEASLRRYVKGLKKVWRG